MSVQNTWSEKLVFVRALLAEPEPSKDMDQYLQGQLKDTLSQLSSITVEDEQLFRPEHKTETNNDVVSPEYLHKLYQQMNVRQVVRTPPRYLPKSPLRYDELQAIKSEFSSYQFPYQNQTLPTLLMSHLSIWTLGKVLRMARKL